MSTISICKWRLAPMIGFLMIQSCATAEAQPREKSLADATPEPSAEVTAPDTRAGDILSLLAEIYPGWPESSEGGPTMKIEVAPDETNGFVATVIQTGLLDDSVAQIKDRLAIIQDRGGEWFVIRAEQWRKCYRTGMFEWTAKPCP